MGSRLSWASLVGAALVASQANAQAQPAGPGPLPDEAANQGSAAPPAADTAAVTPVSPPLGEQPAMPPAPPPPPAELVVRESGISRTNTALLVGAGAGLAAGLCLFIAAQGDDGDADVAASYDDYSRISARADRLRIASVITAGAGVALGVLAAYRIKVAKESTSLAISPRKGGAALVLERSW